MHAHSKSAQENQIPRVHSVIKQCIAVQGKSCFVLDGIQKALWEKVCKTRQGPTGYASSWGSQVTAQSCSQHGYNTSGLQSGVTLLACDLEVCSMAFRREGMDGGEDL